MSAPAAPRARRGSDRPPPPPGGAPGRGRRAKGRGPSGARDRRAREKEPRSHDLRANPFRRAARPAAGVHAAARAGDARRAARRCGAHAAYVQSWLAALRGDKRFILKASADAQRGADYLIAAMERGMAARAACARAPEGVQASGVVGMRGQGGRKTGCGRPAPSSGPTRGFLLSARQPERGDRHRGGRAGGAGTVMIETAPTATRILHGGRKGWRRVASRDGLRQARGPVRRVSGGGLCGGVRDPLVRASEGRPQPRLLQARSQRRAIPPGPVLRPMAGANRPATCRDRRNFPCPPARPFLARQIPPPLSVLR